MSQFSDWVDQLAESEDTTRVEIHMALAEVYARLREYPNHVDAGLLNGLRRTLQTWLRGDDDRRMGGFRDDDDMPPFRGGPCMCSIERLEARTKRGD